MSVLIVQMRCQLRQAVLMCEESAAHLENLRLHNDELSDNLAQANQARSDAEAARVAMESECESLRRANALATGTVMLCVCHNSSLKL